MPIYKVTIRRVEHTDIEIEAPSEQAARDRWYSESDEAGIETGSEYSECDISSITLVECNCDDRNCHHHTMPEPSDSEAYTCSSCGTVLFEDEDKIHLLGSDAYCAYCAPLQLCLDCGLPIPDCSHSLYRGPCDGDPCHDTTCPTCFPKEA